MEKDLQQKDSFTAFSKYEEQELVESEKIRPQQLTYDRKALAWHSDYIIESNVVYCFLTEDREPLTLQEALKSPEASQWMATM